MEDINSSSVFGSWDLNTVKHRLGWMRDRAYHLRMSESVARLNGSTEAAIIYGARAEMAEAYVVRMSLEVETCDRR